MNWTLAQLNPAMRKQVEAKLRAGATVRTHVLLADNTSNSHRQTVVAAVATTKKRKRPQISAVQRLLIAIELDGLPVPEREVRCSPDKRFRLDLAWKDRKIGVEVDGGVFIGGRHTRGVGYTRDCVKRNLATENGWRIFNFTTSQAVSGYAINLLKRVLG